MTDTTIVDKAAPDLAPGLAEMNLSQDFCFCTLAVGRRYRAHARMLARDIQEHSPNTLFVVLTDRPADFADYVHVLAMSHRLQSVQGYHDKRFAVEKALTQFEACMYLDSDVRILGPVPPVMDWLPGITARTGCNILKHNSGETVRAELPAIEGTAQTLGLDLSQTQWFHEFMFTVKKQDGAELDFLKFWQSISYYFELQGLYAGEGNVMGLAAAKAGVPVRFDSDDRFPFFKDNIEQVRLRHGQSDWDSKKRYFEIHRSIEHPDRTVIQKLRTKISKKLVFWYRWSRLRFVVKKDANYQTLF